MSRVVIKYKSFLERFPTLGDLAKAPLSEVIVAWSGLGYNRRAKYLREAARQLEQVKAPWAIDDLMACKGIGHNTAAAVVTYTYNKPIPFIETNVRTVLIHHFFADQEGIDDKELIPIMEAVLDQEHPREFMWAIMDYGSHLKASVGNLNRQSKQYAKQSAFHGSKRQLRGEVLRQLADGPQSLTALEVAITDVRLPEVLASLEQDGLIVADNKHFSLAP